MSASAQKLQRKEVGPFGHGMAIGDDRVRDAVLKVALGFRVEEVTEEYDARDGELKLVKRRETHKDIPPDLKAAKLLLEGTDFSSLSDEELEEERAKLIRALGNENKETTA